jgi:anaerobic ribonucleoside-triphosphate reductase
MYINISYDREFVDYFMYLKSKYPKELFNLEGIGEQLDISKFSRDFFSTKTVADVSVDSNSNVDDNSVMAYSVEISKALTRLNSIYLIWKGLRKIYSTQIANEFMELQLTGEIYINDLSQVNLSYCQNFDCMDIANKGLPFVNKIKSAPPKHLSSFVGQMIHFMVYASNSVLGAVGLGNFLIVFSYYSKKLLMENENVSQEFLWKQIKQELQSFIYSANQPFRSSIQSGFYNVSIYDDIFLNQMANEYIFPDGSLIDIKHIKEIQELYIDLMNDTLKTSPITFPVTTACIAVDDNRKIIDENFVDFIAKKNQEFAFINIFSGKSSILSSCCRLRSDQKNEYFNSFGSGGSRIGSLGVVTINLPRIAYTNKTKEEYINKLSHLADLCIKINNVKRNLIQSRISEKRYPLYNHGLLDLTRQYSTVGITGVNEACEIIGYDILSEQGQSFVMDILTTINNLNDKASAKYNAPHNTEQVPSESSAVKLANKDRLLKLNDKYELYSNQFIPLIKQADLLDRIKLQGLFDSHMTGGAICHIHVEEKIEDYKDISKLIKKAVELGVVYHAINYNLQECENGHMTVGKREICPKCNGKIIGNFVRVVGFLTKVENWNKVRREFEYPERVFYKGV